MTRNSKVVFDEKALKTQLMQEAKAVGLSKMTAEAVTENIILSTKKWVADKPVITEDDLNRAIARAAKRYSRDLAYVYENRGKII